MKRSISAVILGFAVASFATVALAQRGPHGGPAGHLARPIGIVPAKAADPSKPGAVSNGETPEAATAEEGAAEGEGEHALKSINWADFSNTKQVPYVVYLGNFAILLFLYYRLGKKPVAEGLKSRRDSIAKEIEDAQRMKKEAKQRKKKYQAKLEGLDDELAAAKAGLIEAGKADKERIVKEAEEKAARMNRDAAALLEQEKRQIHEDLVNETVEAAVLEAEEILKKRVMPEDHERLAEDFLASLNKRPAPSLAPNGSIGGGAS